MPMRMPSGRSERRAGGASRDTRCYLRGSRRHWANILAGHPLCATASLLRHVESVRCDLLLHVRGMKCFLYDCTLSNRISNRHWPFQALPCKHWDYVDLRITHLTDMNKMAIGLTPYTVSSSSSIRAELELVWPNMSRSHHSVHAEHHLQHPS